MKKRILSLFLVFCMMITALGMVPVNAAEQQEQQTLLTSTMESKIVNVAFVIDSTGSMYDEIDNVKKNLSKFVDYLGEKDIKVRMSLIDYQDITYDGMDSTTVHTLNHSVWFETTTDMNRELSSIALGDGGDLAETLVDGMGYVLDKDLMTFNTNAVKFAFVLTDAPYKVNNRHGIKDMSDLVQRLNEMGMYTSVVTSKSYMKDYQPLAYYDPKLIENNISPDGYTLWDIKDDFGKILIDFAEYILNVPIPEPSPDIAVKGVEIPEEQKNITMKPGETRKIDAKIIPSDATNQTIDWYSENEDVVSVTDGLIKANNNGYSKITAVTNDGGYTATVTIVVTDEGMSGGDTGEDDFDEDDGFTDINENDSFVSFNLLEISTDSIEIAKGNSYQLQYDVYPEQTVTFTSENPKVAKVDENGKVIAINKGMTVITATTEDGTTTAECKVTVLVKPTKIVLNYNKKVILKVGDRFTLKAKIAPANVNKKYKTVMWTSSNPKVATVSKTGVVRAKKEGSCVITVNTLNGYKASCTIVVQENPNK